MQDLYVIRAANGLYYLPNGQGYTGVPANAGLHSLSEAQAIIQETDATYIPLARIVQNDLIPRLSKGQIASCKCGTKTPDIEYHSSSCPYRLLSEAEILLRRLSDLEMDSQ